MDQSAMFSNRGKGRGRGRDRGRDSGGGRGFFGGRQGESDKDSRQCGHCGRTNHISEKCWEKFGCPQWAQVADTESTNSSISTTTSGGPAVTAPTVQISQADYERLRQLELSQNIHSATHASSSGMDAYIASSHKPWVLDSEASSHMTGIKDHFVSLHLSDKFPSIRIADGTLSPVRGDRVVHATSFLKLIDVLYVPKFPDLATGMKIGSGHEREGCESCELGKHHRATFQSRVDKHSSFVFELVHSDVWGPYRVPSVQGFRYFIIFVDDFSRMTWLYLLKERSEVSHVIELFYNEIKTQFSTSVRILRTDNALEYMKSDVSKFCALNGIIHQTSCSHTSQQNGVAERKHRHILDVPLPSSAPTTIPLPAPVAPAPKPLLTYSCRPKVHAPESATAEASSPAVDPSHVETSIPSDLDIPIALRKGKRSCPKYPISLFVSYDRLNPSFRQFALSLSTVSIPRSYEKAMLVPAWKQTLL
ncbi:uncharacterized protein LOC109834580 [Asparagus officinalis]|uniref:uncharacterized protein LOC109834580 n=1 Tax=Asparagus officinalis TaxID=4686 RepID=UPI00098E08FC|nr:uncharacterized protein LOC109834580 [Asparagus officinalis]